MAQTPEAKVKAFIDKFMVANFPGIWKYAPPGGPFGNVGAPDRFYLWKGVFIAIEAKAEGNKPTERQLMHLIKINENGGVAAVVTGLDKDKMEKIRGIILRRVQLADEKSGTPAIPASEGDGSIPD
jgi:hypothetical protein